MNKETFDQVRGLAQLLYNHVGEVPKNDQDLWTVPAADRPQWDTWFRKLILTNILPDGTAFGAETNDHNLGMGTDAKGYRSEFYQLLMQCYRYLYLALSSGEVFLQPGGWILSDGGASAAPGQEENA